MQIAKKIKTKEDERKLFEEELIKSLLKSEEDIERGRIREATDVFNEWKKQYGI